LSLILGTATEWCDRRTRIYGVVNDYESDCCTADGFAPACASGKRKDVSVATTSITIILITFIEFSTHEGQIEYLEMEGFDEDTIKTFRKLKLSTVDDITPETRQMWIKYNGRVPRKHDARRCWVRPPPTDGDLFAATISQIEKWRKDPSLSCTVLHRGEPDDTIDPIKAIIRGLKIRGYGRSSPYW
jgi:hypothetical protein